MHVKTTEIADDARRAFTGTSPRIWDSQPENGGPPSRAKLQSWRDADRALFTLPAQIRQNMSETKAIVPPGLRVALRMT